MLELKRAPLTVAEQAGKRCIDLVIATPTILLLAPLLLLAAAAVRLDSRGPVFFRPERVGFNGRVFRMNKFRTMTVPDDEPVLATGSDARVTRVGRWLRRTSIDELPQLLNVIAGDMSLVGPRPHAAGHESKYDALIAKYALRQHVKPGITGCSQVSGLRGETSSPELIQRRIERDFWYIENWSLALDFRVLLAAVVEAVGSRRTY